MKLLITGSSGHLGEGLMRVLAAGPRQALGVDLAAGPFTARVGSIADPAFVASCMSGVTAIIHAATLHKPHVETHTRRDFIDTNVTGTQVLLDAAVAAGVSAFVFTSTTSVYGRAMTPAAGDPAVWVTEDVVPQPKNVYGVTKLAAENLCELAHRLDGLPCVVLRTSRFFPEDDDNRAVREAFDGDNTKLNEFLHRRADLEDVVSAHLAAVEQAPRLGFGRFIVSAPTPLTGSDVHEMRRDLPAVVSRHVDFQPVYARRGWRMFPTMERVYDSSRARAALDWRPRHDFRSMLARVESGGRPMSELAAAVGAKGYHAEVFEDGPYPVA